MQVNVLLFASYAERFGATSLAVPLGDGATVGDVVAHLRALPGGDALPARPLVARNLRHVALEEPVAADDEVALLPPMAGG